MRETVNAFSYADQTLQKQMPILFLGNQKAALKTQGCNRVIFFLRLLLTAKPLEDSSFLAAYENIFR